MTIDDDLVRRSTSTRNARAVDQYLLSTAPHNQDDDEMRLVSHLLKTYNKEVRPVQNKSDAVQVIFGMAYTQLLDLVRYFHAHFISSFQSCRNCYGLFIPCYILK